MVARLLRLAHGLRAHRLAGWSLDRWGAFLPAAGALLLIARWILRGQPLLPAWHWFTLALLAGACVGMLAFSWWAKEQAYVIFSPWRGGSPEGMRAPSPVPLDPADKVPLRATGSFAVEGRSHFAVDLLAYWRTYASREHVVLAIQHPSRFLLFGSLPAEETGMWYMFIPSPDVLEVIPGELSAGARPKPGLRITYRARQAARGRRAPRTIRETAYLDFESDQDRDRVWADLLAGNAWTQTPPDR